MNSSTSFCFTMVFIIFYTNNRPVHDGYMRGTLHITHELIIITINVYSPVELVKHIIMHKLTISKTIKI